MFSVALGISLLAHITIIFAAKARSFLNFGLRRKNTLKPKHGAVDKAFTSLAIAAITEFVILLALISSFAILGTGILSDKSNYKIIKGILNKFESKELGAECIFQKKCDFDHPDASISIS